MTRFPDLEKLEDREIRIAAADAAVADLKKWADQYSGLIADRELIAQRIEESRNLAEATRGFSADIEAMKNQFLILNAMSDSGDGRAPQGRGVQFEKFLTALFELFDMEPRLSYSLEREQIDGSLSFDTDDYIVEAKWWKSAVDRRELDIFDSKVRRKGKNALGIFVSVSGFTKDALDEYENRASFVTFDGGDLFLVLEGRIRLDDLLKRKNPASAVRSNADCRS